MSNTAAEGAKPIRDVYDFSRRAPVKRWMHLLAAQGRGEHVAESVARAADDDRRDHEDGAGEERDPTRRGVTENYARLLAKT